MLRVLCAGDLHLGAGSNLGNVPGERLAGQEAVLEKIVAIANELDVDGLLWAGDAWERRRPTPAEILAFKRPLEKLNARLVGIAGNHDVEAFTRPTGYDVIERRPAGMERAFWDAEIVAGPDFVLEGDATICRLPWAPPGNLVAIEGGGDRDEVNATLAAGLVEIARGLYLSASGPTRDPDKPIILLAHWSVGGAETPTGVPAELFREPVLDLQEVAAIGFDAVVLGHIHKPQLLVAPSGPTTPGPVFYVGSPMPLNFGEAASPHSVTLLEIANRQAQVFEIPIESRRLLTMKGEAKSDGSLPWVWPDDLSAIRDSIVKVQITATEEAARRLDVAAIRRFLLEEAGAHKVWAIQTEIARAETVRIAGVDETIDDAEAFDLWLDHAAAPGRFDHVDELRDLHNRYLQEVQL